MVTVLRRSPVGDGRGSSSVAHVEAAQVVALMMGRHARLGYASNLRLLPSGVMRHIGELAYWPRFDATFSEPVGGCCRMGALRNEIGWSVERDKVGFVAVQVRDPILPKHGVVALELTYTAIDEGAVFSVGDVELRMEEVIPLYEDTERHAWKKYATLGGAHVPALDGVWNIERRISVRVEVDAVRGTVSFAVDDIDLGPTPLKGDWKAGVRVSAEDHSDGAPLEGDTEWCATLKLARPKREARSPPVLCASPTCFCRRRHEDLAARLALGTAYEL